MRDKDDIKIEIRQNYRKALGDNNALRTWFNHYNHLALADLAACAGVQRSSLYRLRKKIGLVVPSEKRIHKIKSYPSLDALPEDWREKEIFIKLYNTYGPKNLSEASGLSLRNIFHIRQKFLGTKVHKPHKCDDYDWLMEHYVKQRLSHSKCAKIACVSTVTINQWLIKHGIHRRSQSYAIPLWIREVVREMYKFDCVRKIKIKYGHLQVHYFSNIKEYYFFNNYDLEPSRKSYIIRPHTSEILHDIRVKPVYGFNLDGSFNVPSQIKVPDDFEEFNILEKRLAINDFLFRFGRHYYKRLSHTDDALKEDLERCRSINTNRYMRDGVLQGVVSYGTGMTVPGHKIAEHFFMHNFTSRLYGLKRANDRHRIVHEMFKNNRKITSSNFWKFVCQNQNNLTKRITGARTKFYKDFGALYTLLKLLNIKGRVLDISPSFGYNALACGIAGLDYYYLRKYNIDRAFRRGFGEFVGFNHKPYEGEDFELLLYYCQYYPDDEFIKLFHARAKRMIVYVPQKAKSFYEKNFRPEIIIKLKRTRFNDSHDYVMVW